MDTLLQQLINGLPPAGLTAFVAPGYTRASGITGRITFHTGEVVMLGTKYTFTLLVAVPGSDIPPSS